MNFENEADIAFFEECLKASDENIFEVKISKQICERAIKALEKQMPKKPIKKDVGGWLIWECPSCGDEVGCHMRYRNSQCSCGQAIDWSVYDS